MTNNWLTREEIHNLACCVVPELVPAVDKLLMKVITGTGAGVNIFVNPLNLCLLLLHQAVSGQLRAVLRSPWVCHRAGFSSALLGSVVADGWTWGFWRSFHASWFYDSLKLDYSNKTWVTFQSEGTVIRRANAVATLQWLWIMCNLVKKMCAFKKNKALWMEGCIQRLPNHLHKNTRVWFFLGGKGFPNSILFSVFPTLCLPRSYPMHIHILSQTLLSIS